MLSALEDFQAKGYFLTLILLGILMIRWTEISLGVNRSTTCTGLHFLVPKTEAIEWLKEAEFLRCSNLEQGAAQRMLSW